ncbi:acyltransferase ChoActase/COT/CPT [Dichomitus squalens LYAD-421 SS1]|uniref:acyltransferase ChoActase/COT/CPT n=1 Tax=Dichomitus squalens (strain LYAD-421) TaxID=732165 RepID=UPI000441560E|nr:acyltransferase ChoActase/COT/CPT [Dichomitus squalens LYAD-421 SS1]EJF64957.1 acyltransferase ChoActase/COT/CPT [Dichomitus squalens LYAD-421 SS1]
MQSHLVSPTRRANSTRTTPTLPSLPRLPVPLLNATLSAYLKSLEPFLLEDAARGGPDFKTAYDARLKLAQDFEQGIGSICQRRLLELDKHSPHNWLDDNIWLQKAYHEWRAPLIVNSNWWLALADDPSVPPAVRYPKHQVSGFTNWQIRRAAWLVHRVLDFKAQLDRQDIYPDTTRTGLWFRHAALQSFHKCRIPQRGCDRLSTVPSPSDPSSRKLLVMVADWMYAVDVVDSDGGSLPPNTIEKRLRVIVQDAEARLERGERPVPIGVLTTDDRDIWAANLEHLLSLSPSNRTLYTTLASSVFALSLDPYAYTLPPSHQTHDADLATHLHNVRSGDGARPGHNRWYDKPFTLIVEANTRAGVLGEHSPVDALVPSVVADYAIVQGVDDGAFSAPLNPSEEVEADEDVHFRGWERMDWVVDGAIVQACEETAMRAKVVVDDSDADELVFDAYGVDWIKNEAGLSPDGYIQMALQLAWYRTRGEFTATYETALTRAFQHGRTETIRTLSADSQAWVLAMADPHCEDATRLELLRRAVQTHTSLTRRAATGRGLDRHLLGLRLMLRPDAGESHPLFEDELFGRSQAWKLSTSGLSAGYQFRGTGFGAAYPDGYGINYMPALDRLRFGVESKHSCAHTSTWLFMAAITNALQDMKALCTSTLQAHL